MNNKQVKNQDEKQKSNIIWKITTLILVIVVIILLLLKGCNTNSVTSNNTSDTNNTDIYGDYEVSGEKKERVPEEVKQQKELGNIRIVGFGKATVTEKNPSIELYNPDVNFVDFVFTVTDKETGELIGKTNKVPAGNYVYMNVMNFYKEPGVYNVNINISTFDSETGQSMNGANQLMEITVK